MTNLSSESPVSPVQAHPLTLKVKHLTSIAIFLECITFGCAFNFFSPVLVELKNKYETDIDSMSKVFIVLTLSYLSGAMAGGVIYSKIIKRQHGVFCAFIGISLSLFATPYCPTITTLFITVGVLGFFCGAYDTAQTVWIMEMWQSKSGPYIQAQHFCFALGTNLPSLLTAPYLPSDVQSHEKPLSDNHEFSYKIPFTIVAGMALMNACYELFLIVCFPYSVPERESSACDAVICSNDDNDNCSKIIACLPPESEAHLSVPTLPQLKASQPNSGSNSHKIQLVILSGLFLGFYQGMEMVSLQFIPTLAQFGNSKLSLSGAEAALVLTGLTGAFAIGRAIGILITFRVPPQLILSANALLVIVGNVILLAWAYLGLSNGFLWSSCIVLGLGFSTMYASFCAFMERHLVFTDFVGCVMLISGSVVGMIYPVIVGKFVERHPEVVTYTNFFSVVLCSLAFVAAYFITRKSIRNADGN